MKLFFNASLSGKKEYLENYKAIVSVLEKLEVNLTAAPVLQRTPDEVAKETVEEAGKYYKNLRRWICQADMAVFEVSFPSTGVGHEVAMALNMGRPVIALFVRGRRPYILESIPEERLQVIEYDLADLASLLKDAIDYASERMDTRFNFFISPQIANYLDWVAKHRRMSRAIFLRGLIDEAMKKDKEYKESDK